MTRIPMALAVGSSLAFSYADATARAAGEGDLTTTDVNKIAVQEDDGTLWRLTDDSPITWQQIGGGASPAPTHAILFPMTFTRVGETTQYTILTDGGQPFNIEIVPDGIDDGDDFEITFRLAAGDYKMIVCGKKANNRGILDWRLDGDLIVTGQDWYAASDESNFRFTDDVEVATSGDHVLRFSVNGKNGSSADFVWSLSAIWFYAV